MATLTIKPTAAGNDVQIKSGDGNTTHATFGDTNNISMSTGSIASAVTGTLGSGITFPSGHILQVKHSYECDSPVTVAGNSDFTAVGNSYYTFPWGTEITTTVANSLIFLTAQIGNAYATAGNPTLQTSIARYKAGTEEALVGAQGTAGATGGAIGYTTGGPTYGMSRQTSMDQQKAVHISILDKPLDPAGTVLKYYIVAICLSTSAGLGYETHNTLTAMEVMP